MTVQLTQAKREKDTTQRLLKAYRDGKAMFSQDEPTLVQRLLAAYRGDDNRLVAPDVAFSEVPAALAPAPSSVPGAVQAPSDVAKALAGDKPISAKTRALLATTYLGRATIAQWDAQHAPAK